MLPHWSSLFSDNSMSWSVLFHLSYSNLPTITFYLNELYVFSVWNKLWVITYIIVDIVVILVDTVYTACHRTEKPENVEFSFSWRFTHGGILTDCYKALTHNTPSA